MGTQYLVALCQVRSTFTYLPIMYLEIPTGPLWQPPRQKRLTSPAKERLLYYYSWRRVQYSYACALTFLEMPASY